MFIDDESSLVETAESFLKRLGYRVSGFTSSMAAIEQFRASPEDFDLVITDMTMPRMTGDNLSRKMIAVREDIPIILCTGFNEQISEKKARETGRPGNINRNNRKYPGCRINRNSSRGQQLYDFF